MVSLGEVGRGCACAISGRGRPSKAEDSRFGRCNIRCLLGYLAAETISRSFAGFMRENESWARGAWIGGKGSCQCGANHTGSGATILAAPGETRSIWKLWECLRAQAIQMRETLQPQTRWRCWCPASTRPKMTWILCIIYIILFIIYFILYIVNYILYIIYNILNIIYNILYIRYYILYFKYYILYIKKYILYIIHDILYTMYYIFYTIL